MPLARPAHGSSHPDPGCSLKPTPESRRWGFGLRRSCAAARIAIVRRPFSLQPAAFGRLHNFSDALQQSPRRARTVVHAASGRPVGHARRRHDVLGRDRPPRSKKQKIKPWLSRQWCISTLDAEFLARMEDLLELYARPYDPAEPVVCFDEMSIQLLGEVRDPLPASAGHPARHDYEYVRGGTANLLVALEPLAGWRDVAVTDQRTKVDFAHRMRFLALERYPDARVIHVVLDNLNTHTLGALYKAFPAADARRIARQIQFHHTPVHGSWLNMVEIENSVLSRACLARRIPTAEALRAILRPWQDQRNAAKALIEWRFSLDSARCKFNRFYQACS